MLDFADLAKFFIVNNEYLNRKGLSSHSFQFLNIHLETTVTGYAKSECVPTTDRSTNSIRKSNPHGAVTAANNNPSFRAFEPQ
ncbi:hypothetical protein SDC9_182798 [bioreactor metagenome]|uniref:Uncharacterized protein n=1 Tax=bioreactor metagenome TaxID=1076179 RepID=A0A645H8D8_9ZZZZ